MKTMPWDVPTFGVRLRVAALVSLLVVVIGFPLAGAVTIVFVMIGLQNMGGPARNLLPEFIVAAWCAAVAGVLVVTKLVSPYVSRVSANHLHAAPMVGSSTVISIGVVAAMAQWAGQEYWWLWYLALAPPLGALAGSYVPAGQHPMIVGTIVGAVVILVCLLSGIR